MVKIGNTNRNEGIDWIEWNWNDDLSNKLKAVQYNATLTITGAIKSTSRRKFYQELGSEYLQHTRWMRRLCLIYTIASTKLPEYIYDLIPPVRQSQGHPNISNSFSSRIEHFKNSFFPNVVCECNKLNPEICNSGSYNIFRKSLLNFIRQILYNIIFYQLLYIIIISMIWSPLNW